MKSKTPKHLVQAHRLICGHEKLKKKSHSKAEFRHLNDVRRIFEDRNIVGLGIAEKMTEKKRTGELTLCFYVKEKKGKRRLDSHKAVPPVIGVGGGAPVFTDVYEIGVLKAQINRHKNPIQSGYSVGNENTNDAGTVGAIVLSEGTHYILSNAHVLAPNGIGAIGDRIIYPALIDSQALRPVATLLEFVKLKATQDLVNTSDAALAEIDSAFLPSIEFSIFGAASPRVLGNPQKDMKIVMNGRTSGEVANGIVRDVNFSGLVDVPGLGMVGFTNQVICNDYSREGDSGSLIVAKNTGEIVGLHVAGSSKGSMFTPIKIVQESLRISFRFK